MNVEKLLLRPAYLRIVNDLSIQNLVGVDVQAVKGPKRPDNMPNPCFTIHSLTNPKDDNLDLYGGTLLINVFAGNHDNGTANSELLGEVADQVEQLFDNQPLQGQGGYMYNLRLTTLDGPLCDPSKTEEHFMSLRFRYNLRT